MVKVCARLMVPAAVALAALAVALSAPVPAFADNALNYDGTIGTAGVGMTLYTKDVNTSLLPAQKVVGKYFYNQYLRDIKLEGETDGNRGITLYELNSDGSKVAVMKGKFPETDPAGNVGRSKLESEVFQGTWCKMNGEGSLPLALRMRSSTVVSAPGGAEYSVAGVDDATVFETKVQKFRTAVINGDRKVVASQLSYPVLTEINGKRRSIANSAELLKNYDQIFTPSYIDAIKKSVPHNMFARYDGVMLGERGEVWFDADGKVKTLNTN